MKQKMKQLMSVLLSLAMVFGLMPGMSLTAYAATDTYTALKNDATVVQFNGYNWYIIEDNSTSATEGTVTLLAADDSFGKLTFKSDMSSNSYNQSDVKEYLDKIVAGTAGEGKPNFAGVADAIQPVTLTTYKYDSTTEVAETTEEAKLYLLDTATAQNLNSTILNYNFPSADMGSWWLRSPGSYDTIAACVFGEYGGFLDFGFHVA